MLQPAGTEQKHRSAGVFRGLVSPFAVCKVVAIGA